MIQWTIYIFHSVCGPCWSIVSLDYFRSDGWPKKMSYRRNVVQEPHIHVVIIRIPKETANVHFAMWKPFYVFKYISLLILFTAYGIMLNVRFVFFVLFFCRRLGFISHSSVHCNLGFTILETWECGLRLCIYGNIWLEVHSSCTSH